MIEDMPKKVSNFFETEYFDNIKSYFTNHEILLRDEYQYYGSKRIDSFNDSVLKNILNDSLPIAKKYFGNEDILPTYAIFSEYSGEQAYLSSHKDAGPCTYTIDVCLYQKTPWPLIIENKEYFFYENEAILFLANDQEHSRPEFPDPENNKVAILLLHYADKNHQWFSLPDDVKKLLRSKIFPL